MPLQATTAPLVASDRRTGLAINALIEHMRQGDPMYAEAMSLIQAAVNDIYRTLRTPAKLQELTVTDPTGKQIMWVGSGTFNHQFYKGFWTSEAYIGPGGPGVAPFYCDGSNVIIGKNGAISIRDIGDTEVAWLGVKQDAAKVITAATNASPSELTISSHGYISGDTVLIAGAIGNTAINGYRVVVKVDANKFTLKTGAGVAINGNGTYTVSSGTAVRYYAGLLTQTVAIGASFANYKLRAFADGTLKIQDAQITLAGTGATIDLNPTTGQITVTETSPGTRRVTIDGNGITVDVTSGTAYFSRLSETSLTLKLDNSNLYQIVANSGAGMSIDAPTGTFATSKLFDVRGYAGSTAYGPVVALQHFRGTGASPTASQSGDTLGGLIVYGSDRTVDDYYGGLRVVATEAAGAGAHGAKIVFETVANGGTTLAVNMTLDHDGTLNVIGGYKANSSVGISTTKTFGTGVTGGFESTALKGTPGVGQSQFSAMTSLTLNTGTITTVGGIVTA